MPDTYGTGKPRVAILPLALILALHLVLVLLWAASTRKPVDQGAEPRHFTLTWLPALRPRAPPPPAPARVRPPAARAPSAPPVAPSSSAQAVSVRPEMPQPSAAPAAGAPDAFEVNQLIDSARRQAGMIDRELRDGKPAQLTPAPDLPFNRFRSALEGAYNDRSRVMMTDSLTQPDGVIVYRFRRGGKVWCRQSGGGGPGTIERSEGARLGGAGSAGGGSAAGTISCPSGASGWAPL
jgi:hypothetical protein